MRNDITEKLRTELSTEIQTEPQVVYILSRIRKILEVDKDKGFKILKFYCDWALHAEIENVDAVKEILEGIVAGRDEPQINFFLYNPLHKELVEFLKKNDLPTTMCDSSEKRQRFNSILSQIYTDTPLIVRSVKKTVITWKGNSNGMSYSGSFHIETER